MVHCMEELSTFYCKSRAWPSANQVFRNQSCDRIFNSMCTQAVVFHPCPLYSSAASNPCGSNNGNCSHLCLLSAIATSGYTCDCPNGLVLEDDQRSCGRCRVFKSLFLLCIFMNVNSTIIITWCMHTGIAIVQGIILLYYTEKQTALAQCKCINEPEAYSYEPAQNDF